MTKLGDETWGFFPALEHSGLLHKVCDETCGSSPPFFFTKKKKREVYFLTITKLLQRFFVVPPFLNFHRNVDPDMASEELFLVWLWLVLSVSS